MGLDPNAVLAGQFGHIDVHRARVLSEKSASLFSGTYEAELGGASTATARRQADSVALARVEKRIELQVVTENAEAWNAARSSSRIAGWDVHLYKLWDAWLDKRTCEVCYRLDGTLIPRGEKFRDPVTRKPTRPGKIHPRCRCEEQYVTLAEARQLGLRTAT